MLRLGIKEKWKTTQREDKEDDLKEGFCQEQPKRLKYNLLGEEWGETQVVVVPGCQPFVQLPQRRNRRLHYTNNQITNQTTSRLVDNDIRRYVENPIIASDNARPRGMKGVRGEESYIVMKEHGPFEEDVSPGPTKRSRTPGEEEKTLVRPALPPRTKQTTLDGCFSSSTTMPSGGGMEKRSISPNDGDIRSRRAGYSVKASSLKKGGGATEKAEKTKKKGAPGPSIRQFLVIKHQTPGETTAGTNKKEEE